MPTVVIDCGHGGSDSGAVGSSNGLFESHAVLDIGLIVRDILRPHVDVLMTRETDEFVSLPERCRIANDADADIFVSIHLNSATTDANGFEVFTSGSDASVQLAGNVLNAHAQTFPQQRNRGVKQASFYVLVNTTMPAILWEGCFLSNADENDWVSDDSVRVDMAQAIADGVLAYYGISDSDSDQELTLEQRVVRIEEHLGL